MFIFNTVIGKSRTPDVVGIIVIFLASWYLFALLLELLGISYNLNSSYLLEIKLNKNNAYNFGSSQQNIIHLIGMTGAVWLLFIGRGLTQYKDWARKQLNYYVFFSQFNALLLFVYAIKTSPIDGTVTYCQWWF